MYIGKGNVDVYIAIALPSSVVSYIYKKWGYIIYWSCCVLSIYYCCTTTTTTVDMMSSIYSSAALKFLADFSSFFYLYENKSPKKEKNRSSCIAHRRHVGLIFGLMSILYIVCVYIYIFLKGIFFLRRRT